MYSKYWLSEIKYRIEQIIINYLKILNFLKVLVIINESSNYDIVYFIIIFFVFTYFLLYNFYKEVQNCNIKLILTKLIKFLCILFKILYSKSKTLY